MDTLRETIYGRQPVLECLRAGRRRVYRLTMGRGIQPSETVSAILALAEERRIPVRRADGAPIEGIERGDNHQGMAAEVSEYPYAEIDAVLDGAGPKPLLLLLDHVQDPQNLGALLRTADAAGVQTVILPKDRAAEVTPAVVRASAGAAEHVQVCRVVNLHQAMEKLKKREIWLAGLETVPEATLYTEADLRGALGLVVGSEGRGLSRLIRESCDFLIRVPMLGRVGSLNASVAGAVALYEIRRQRDAKA